MVITQSVTIPANHRLTIDVPPNIPAGGYAVITFMPADEVQSRIADDFVDGPPSHNWKKIPVDFETANNLGIPMEFLTESDRASTDKRYEFDTGKYIKKLLESDNNSNVPVIPLAELYGERIFGLAKGHISTADDFDAPLEDFKDYM
jgi:hypothetical protein